MTSVPQSDDQLLALLSEVMPAPEASFAKARVRAQVMAVAREQLEPRTSPLLGPVGLAAAAASAVVALGSGGAISASANALPGEALYSLKIAVEEVQSALAVAANDPVAQVAVEEERATKRVAEIETLAAQNKPIPQEVTRAAATRSEAAAAAAARVPEASRPAVEQKREAAQAKREETLTRVITQVPPPAQTAIANTLERQAARQDDRQERREERQDERDDRRDDRNDNSGPGSNGNRGASGSSNAIPALPRATERPNLAPPPTATARPDDRRRVEPTPQPRTRAAESARQDERRPTAQTPPGRSGSNGSGNSGSGNSGPGNSGSSRGDS